MPRPLRGARDRKPERGSARCAHDPDGADLAFHQARLDDGPESHVDDPPAVGLELSRHHPSRPANRTLQLPAQSARDPTDERGRRDAVATTRPCVVDADLADAGQERPASHRGEELRDRLPPWIESRPLQVGHAEALVRMGDRVREA